MSDKNIVQNASESSAARDTAEKPRNLVKPGQAQDEQQQEGSPSDGLPDEQEPPTEQSGR